MKTELQQQLFDIEPRWFRDKDDLRASLMAFGFECGDGWFPVLKKGMEWIKAHMYDEWSFPSGYTHDFQVMQVKEKFGTLRFYVYGGDKYIDNIISAMGLASSVICEGCGAAGELTTDGGWYRTECNTCRDTRREARGWKSEGPTTQEEQVNAT